MDRLNDDLPDHAVAYLRVRLADKILCHVEAIVAIVPLFPEKVYAQEVERWRSDKR